MPPIALDTTAASTPVWSRVKGTARV